MHLVEHGDIVSGKGVQRGLSGGTTGGINADNFFFGCTCDEAIGMPKPPQGFLLNPAMLIFGHQGNFLKIFEGVDVIRR